MVPVDANHLKSNRPLDSGCKLWHENNLQQNERAQLLPIATAWCSCSSSIRKASHGMLQFHRWIKEVKHTAMAVPWDKWKLERIWNSLWCGTTSERMHTLFLHCCVGVQVVKVTSKNNMDGLLCILRWTPREVKQNKGVLMAKRWTVLEQAMFYLFALLFGGNLMHQH